MTATDVHPYASHAPVFAVDSRTEGVLARDLLRLDVEEGVLGLRALVAHLHGVGPDSDGSADQISYLDGAVIGLGRRLEVSIGPPAGERRIFRGVVSAVEACFSEGAAPYVSVFAEDALMGLRMRERTATYTDMSDAQIVQQIAGEHGLAAAADVEGPTYPAVQQVEESDLAFVRNRALRLNAEIWLDGDDVLHVADREQREGAEIRLVQGNELIAVCARVDLAHQRQRVTFRGWDDKRVEAIAETAESSVVAAEAAAGRLGPDLVADTFGETGISRSRRDVLATETARAYAEAEMLSRARRFVTVEGTTSGTPDLVPGARLDLRRVGRPFDGDGYRVVHARHSYDPEIGYRTRFRAERPAMNG